MTLSIKDLIGQIVKSFETIDKYEYKIEFESGLIIYGDRMGYYDKDNCFNLIDKD